MRQNKIKLLGWLLGIVCILGLLFGAQALALDNNSESINSILNAASLKYANTTEDWEIIAMKAHGAALNNEEKLPAISLKGAMNKAYISLTDYERAAITLSSLGVNANISLPCGKGEEINLIETIANSPAEAFFDSSPKIYALLAYDSGNYEPPANALWSREAVIESILNVQFIENGNPNDGSWGYEWNGYNPDIDTTATAVAALAPYRGEADVEEAIQKALGFLSREQGSDGAYYSWGEPSSNSTAMVIIALASLGRDAQNDADFTKEGHSLMEALLSFKTPDNLFSASGGDISDDYATKQGFLALAAYNKYKTANYGEPGAYYIYRFGTLNSPIPPSQSISVRIEGIEGNILPKGEIILSPDSPSLSRAYDGVLEYIQANGGGLEFSVSANDFLSLKNEEAGYFNLDDGWNYVVDGKKIPSGDYIICGGEEITLYYGDESTLLPRVRDIEYLGNQGVLLRFADEDNLPAEGLNIIWEGDALEAPTNSQGEIIIPPAKIDFTQGKDYSLQIFKNGIEREGKYLPLALRFAPDYKITLGFQQILANNNEDIHLGGSESHGVIFIPLGLNPGELISPGAGLPRLTIIKEQAGGKNILVEFAPNTQISAEGGWDLALNLPIAYSQTTEGKIIISGFSIGKEGALLEFSQPVRIVLENSGDAEKIGFINHENTFTEITAVLGEDTLEAASAALGWGVNEAKIKTGNSWVIWTNHFTSFIAYNERVENTPGGPGNSENVYLRVADPKGQTYLNKKAFLYKNGQTALSLLLQSGLAVIANNSYVSSIEGLAELAHGPESGWIFRVNGEFLGSAAQAAVLAPGDYVEWLYTRDFGRDIGAYMLDGGIPPLTALSGEAQKELAVSLERVLNILKQYKGKEAGFWQAFALARGENLGVEGSEISANLKGSIINEIKNTQGNYTKATDIASAVLAARALGLKPYDIEGINLLNALVNFKNPAKQGSNGLIYTLIAYDFTGLRLPADILNSRPELKKQLKEYQNSDGGFALNKGGISDVDITAAALLALAPYQKEAGLKPVIEKALEYLKKVQQASGGFASLGAENAESSAQVILALCALGIDPQGEEFLKDGKGIIDALYKYQLKDGSFAHLPGGEGDYMATEQGALALIAYNRFVKGDSGLFKTEFNAVEEYKDKETISAWALSSVKDCRNYGLMAGDDKGNFNGKALLTRGEGAKIMANLFMLPKAGLGGGFYDVKDDAWYAPYINSAYENKIITGLSASSFAPKAVISREDFALILARALKLEVSEEYALPKDFNAVSSYAKEGVKAVYAAGLMTGDESGFNPRASLSREMAASILMRVYNGQFN